MNLGFLDQSIAHGIECARAHLTHSVLILFVLHDDLGLVSRLVSQSHLRRIYSQDTSLIVDLSTMLVLDILIFLGDVLGFAATDCTSRIVLV